MPPKGAKRFHISTGRNATSLHPSGDSQFENATGHEDPPVACPSGSSSISGTKQAQPVSATFAQLLGLRLPARSWPRTQCVIVPLIFDGAFQVMKPVSVLGVDK